MDNTYSYDYSDSISDSSSDSTSEHSVSQSDNDDQDSLVSECESCVSSSNSTCEEQRQWDSAGLIKVDEVSKNYQLIRDKFVSGLGSLAAHTSIVSINRIACSSIAAKARLSSFGVFKKAMKIKCGGNANFKSAWYVASKEDITRIVSQGFSHCDKVEDNGLYGCGIYLTPLNHSLQGVKSTVADEDGVRHMLFCIVVMGKMEVVQNGSRQSYPSCEEFDSGVDNLVSPNKYIVWSCYMNSHILPFYTISFRAPPLLQAT